VTFTIVIFSCAVAVIGAAVAVRGWRGKRVGDHPHCRRCGFDLSGRAPDSRGCSECGADLNARNAVVYGAIQQRVGLALAGAMLLFLGLGNVTAVAWGMYQGLSLQKYKPQSWLVYEAISSDPRSRDAALSELIVRLRDGTLSKSNRARLINKALEIQAHHAQPWSMLWGDVIERARRMGLASEEQWKQYVTQAAQTMYVPVHPNNLWQGNPVPWHLEEPAGRVGSSSQLMVETVISGFEVDGQQMLKTPYPVDVSSLASMGSSAGTLPTEVTDNMTNLAEGPHAGRLKLTLVVKNGTAIYGGAQSVAMAGVTPEDLGTTWKDEPVIARVDIEFPFQFRMLTKAAR
jgi:hypothetical protein